MRGLLFFVIKEDVIEFFEGFVLLEDSIYITFILDGRSIGEVFVEFVSVEDLEVVMDKDRNIFGSRYIEFFFSF